VWVDELEASILEKTLRKTTQGHSSATEYSTTGGKKKPPPGKGFF